MKIPERERIAFIWELIVKDEKISHIKVIHDRTKPLLEEAKLVKEYQLKFHRRVLVPPRNGRQLQEITNLVENKNITPSIDSIYNFDDINKALLKVSTGYSQGKVIVTF